MKTLRLALAILAAGCASAPPPIALIGEPEALSALAGNWAGTYRGIDSRRDGSISFSLRAGDTVAYGDVLMIPAGYENHNVWNEREHHAGATPPHPAVLTVAFVGVSDGHVTGMLDPYTDPDCNCLVITAFSGRLKDANTLEGTFLTRAPGSAESRRGVWRVTRQVEK
jgi:hypothetical protein